MQKLPLIKLSGRTELILFLIREDLKIQKLFYHLRELGLSDSSYHPHLGKAILTNLKMDDGSDEVFQFYDQLIEKRSRKIDQTPESVRNQTMKVYRDLMIEKKRQKGGAKLY